MTEDRERFARAQVLLLLSLCIAGCTSDENSPENVLATVVGPPVENPVSEVILMPSCALSDSLQVPESPGESVATVSCREIVELRLPVLIDADENRTRALYFKLIRFRKDRKPIIGQTGTTREVTELAGDTDEFRIQLKMPTVPGDYTVLAYYRKNLISTSHITVVASDEAE